MTFLKYVPSIHIHPILIIFIIISFLTGTFMELSVILLIVLFHELGHYAMALVFNWRIKHIVLWVFGGVMHTEEHGTVNIMEEVLVTIAGPMQHLIIYAGIFLLSTTEIFPSSFLDLVFYYNTAILMFNLIPIWPLDGGKLLLSCLSKLLPFRRAYNYTIMISMIMTLLLLIAVPFIFTFTLSTFFILMFIFMENRTEWRQRYYVFIRFLLKRYEGNTPVRGIKPISVPHQYSLMEVFSTFRREKKHPIYVHFPGNRRKTIDETDCLRCYFYEKKYHQTIGDLAKEI